MKSLQEFVSENSEPFDMEKLGELVLEDVILDDEEEQVKPELIHRLLWKGFETALSELQPWMIEKILDGTCNDPYIKLVCSYWAHYPAYHNDKISSKDKLSLAMFIGLASKQELPVNIAEHLLEWLGHGYWSTSLRHFVGWAHAHYYQLDNPEFDQILNELVDSSEIDLRMTFLAQTDHLLQLCQGFGVAPESIL
jgi:hypothetical protein